MASKSLVSDFKILLKSGDPPKIFDASIRDKWNWSWLSQKDCNDNSLTDYCMKIDKSSCAWCTWCNKQIVYGSGGKKGLLETLYRKKCLEHLNTRTENTVLPAFLSEQNPDPADICFPCNIPYGAASNIHEDPACPTIHNTIPVRPVVGLNDCILHNKAFLLSFAVENNIPISKVSSLVKFAQFLSKDLEAIFGLKLDRVLAN